ncbi:hypothetical protein EJ04DRAFT_13237 [Polyplosphaeria fusca]|uniref:Uncharacterized protein n=1 Tax=Polyplosphaeria fusca TaxID=682080 RepID=A0A9P4QUN0_9PLEO|nr:hypothetical protein EJ04DRAFT_13237 [Polyplosphaeria fusca]
MHADLQALRGQVNSMSTQPGAATQNNEDLPRPVATGGVPSNHGNNVGYRNPSASAQYDPGEGSSAANQNLSLGHGPVKRPYHNLNNMVVGTYVQLPENFPISDGEMIVYFFSSVARPVVALRLRSRGWTPTYITNILNGHRHISPRYLANTCSIKINTAIRRGIETHGQDWHDRTKEAFMNADDEEANALCVIRPEEYAVPFDCDILALCRGLTKYAPAGEGGIFTICVEYCIEHRLSWPLSRVVYLRDMMNDGSTDEQIKTTSDTLMSAMTTEMLRKGHPVIVVSQAELATYPLVRDRDMLPAKTSDDNVAGSPLAGKSRKGKARQESVVKRSRSEDTTIKRETGSDDEN